MSGKLNPIYGNLFRKQFEINCLKLVIQAYHIAIVEGAISTDLEEEDITAILANFIEDNPNRIKWKISMNTEQRLRNDAIKIEKGFAKKSARIDLRFTTIKSPLEFKYYMEAKNLKEKDSALKRRYITTGIDNYLSEKYKDCFLAGYVLAGNLSHTIDGINKLIQSDGRDTEIINISTEKVEAFDCYESIHITQKLRHLFFDFT